MAPILSFGHFSLCFFSYSSLHFFSFCTFLLLSFCRFSFFFPFFFLGILL